MATFKLQVNSAKVSGSHTDFPAYVDLSQMPTAFWDNVTNGGGDIRCYSDEALTTQLPREVVSCDTATNTGELWVKTGMSTTTEIYITVDGSSTEPTASSTYGSQNVWNSNYKAVYHMKDANDSTSNGNNGTVSGATSGATGKIGDGYSFDGVNDKIESSFSLTPTKFSLSFWIYPKNNLDYNQGVGALNGWGAFMIHTTSTGSIYCGTDISTRLQPSNFYSTVYTLNTFHKMTFVYNGSTGYLYKNGNLLASKTMSPPNNFGGIKLGSDSASGTINGNIDEIRLSINNWSADWITTEYNNQSDVSTFWTITDVMPSGTMIKRWNGTAWEEKPLKRYNGSEWENVTIKRYNGSSWDEL